MSAAPKMAGARWWRDAPALRFLSLFLLGWVGLRAAMPVVGALWTEEILATSQGAGEALPKAAAKRVSAAPLAAVSGATVRRTTEASGKGASRQKTALKYGKISGHKRLGPTEPVLALAAPLSEEPSAPRLVPPHENSLPAGAAAGLVIRRADENVTHVSRWSLSTWLFIRDNLARSAANLPVAGELGGSQAGLRAAYALDGAGQADVYGRVSAALGHLQQSEAVFGVSAAPIAGLPVRVAAERRERLGRDGRSAMAVMMVGGVSAKPLPANFRLDAYGQAGVVGLNSRDAFVDGAVVIDHALNIAKEARSLRVGVVLAGAAQPSVERMDVGPRVTLPIPRIGKGARLAVDWRQRVAGNALPKNGASLTFGADF